MVYGWILHIVVRDNILNHFSEVKKLDNDEDPWVSSESEDELKAKDEPSDVSMGM
jgi:hypothetical protein